MRDDIERGYVSFYRKSIMNTPWYFKEKFSKQRAWEFMLTFARYENDNTPLKGIGVTLKKNQLAISQSHLTEFWGWGSRTSVNRFLNELQDLGYITFQAWPEKGKTKTTIITILVYEQFVHRPEMDTSKQEKLYPSEDKEYQQKVKDLKEALYSIAVDNPYTNKKNTPINSNNISNSNIDITKENILINNIIEWLGQVHVCSIEETALLKRAIKRHSSFRVKVIFEKYRKRYPACAIFKPHLDDLKPRLSFLDEIKNLDRNPEQLISFV